MIWHIGEILIQKKWITWDHLQDALTLQKQTGELTGDILMRKGHIAPVFFYRALAEQNGMEFVDLSKTRINPQAVELVPRSICEKYKIFPIERSASSLIVGLSNPLTPWPEMEIRQLARVNKIETVLCLPSDIEKAIEENYSQRV